MLIALIFIFGVPFGIVLFVLYQILKDPNKADKYKALFITPFYKLWKWGAKTYIGSKVSYQVTAFINRHLIKNIAERGNVKVDIKWVESAEDPILKKGNTVIICLKQTNDQARNI